MLETIDWRTIDFEGRKLHAAVLGMAVGGNETQVLIADDINVVKDVAWIHDDKTVSWLVGPKEDRKQKLEKILLGLFFHEE